jgi:hypothetical protein
VVSLVRYRRVAFATLVVLVLAGIYGVAKISHPTAAAARPAATGRATVSTAVRACPAPGSAGPTAASVALAAVPGSAPAGSAVVSALSPAGATSPGQLVATDNHPGVLQFSGVPTAAPLSPAEQAGQPGSSPSVTTFPGSGGVVVTATGALAQGLAVEQTGALGLVTAQCAAPGTSFWFVGPGQASAGNIELYLTNTGSGPADAQVQALTDVSNGPPVLGNADNGITVPPHGMVVQSLGGLLQSSKIMALNVSTTVGQVVAAVRESNSGSQAGIWLPATQAPAQHLVIPGLPPTGSPDLYIAVPGTAPAMIKITAITEKGSYQPTGGTGIDLLGGSVTDIPLPSLDGVAGAVSITASAPVTATMVFPGGPAGSSGALAVSSGQVLEQGVLAANPANPAGSTQLVLSATGKAASVRISTATTSAAGQAGQVVHIRPRSSVVVPVSSSAPWFALVVTPLRGSGPVYGGRIINSGSSILSILPVPSSPTWIPLPGVRQSVSAVVGG